MPCGYQVEENSRQVMQRGGGLRQEHPACSKNKWQGGQYVCEQGKEKSEFMSSQLFKV